MFIYQQVYSQLIVYILFVLALSIVIVTIINLTNNRFWYTQSLFSVYECGFLPFHDSRIQFEVRFYIVALSFIIFDLELCFLVPWFMVYKFLAFYSFSIFFLFYILIIVSFVYELQRGVFDWNKN